MAIEVKMPRLSLTMESGVLLKWLKTVGDPVRKGEGLAEIETDKANALLEAPATGYLRKILVEEGAEVPCDVLVGILTDTLDEPWKSASGEDAPVESSVASSEPAARQVAVPRPDETEVRASPAAKHLAKQLGIDLSTVAGTGPQGRISGEDVQRAADERQRATSPPAAVAVEREQRLPLTKMRVAIAERMIASATTVPQFTVRRRVDMSAAVRFRDERTSLASSKAEKTATPGVADVLHLALSRALRAHPEVNASFEAGSSLETSHLVLHDSVNLGVAFALAEGLIAPVIHNAHEMSLEQLADARQRLQDEARNNRLPASALTGATFTVSNLGTMGVDDFAAIINPPEAAILAVGRMEPTLVVRDGAIHTLPMVTLTVTADHRVLDGAQVAQFLETLADYLSNPDAIA